MNPSAELVNRLWRLCAILRKDGTTYQQYITELTYLLFLKMIEEISPQTPLPTGSRWSDLIGAPKGEKLLRYRDALNSLGGASWNADSSIRRIFENAATVIRDERNFEKLIEQLDQLDWYSDHGDNFGDLYEGLLEKNAEETKRGAGQYFTPRVLIDVIADVMRPAPGEVLQDPAAGTGGFLLAGTRRARQAGGDCLIAGMENVRDAYRLLLMNLKLHGISSDGVLMGDTLSADHSLLPPADVILTNPPFGPAGGRPTRSDLAITSTVSSYAMPFVEHCVLGLKPGGRVAIVVPDSILNEDGRGLVLRRWVMDTCHLHSILRLPSGIFYAQNVKTNVLFLEKQEEGAPGTQQVWLYDLRTNMPTFGKTTPLKRSDFDGFIRFYGNRVDGRDRPVSGETMDERARMFSRNEIAEQGDHLSLSWLRDEAADENLTDPVDLIAAVRGHLQAALKEVDALADEFDIAPPGAKVSV
jgi:type I restriction enzyme M protein